ncbi:hypothetical protein [Lysinibacillus sphaericus]|nr:hypothetical protein [Lysinibacillus sp. SDF0037]
MKKIGLRKQLFFLIELSEQFVREVKEETGIIIDIIEFWWSFTRVEGKYM